MNAPLKMLFHNKSSIFSVAFSIWLICCCCLPSAEPLVVPQELPSILSLIYSNIPPIKKGTDSRLGFGFRLGNHADFQVLVELGPQKNTRPIGEKADSAENSFNKRQISKAHRDYLLRKQAQEALKQFASSSTTDATATGTSTEPTAASWLENWSKAMHSNMKSNNNNDASAGFVVSKKKSTPKFTQIKAHKQQQPEKLQPNVPDAEQTMMQLQMLYRMATTTISPASTIATTPVVESGTEAPITIVTPVPPPVEILQPRFTPFKGGPLNLGGPAGFTPRPPEELSLQTIVEQPSERKTKSEITKELMNVSLEEGE